jgi:hypothetical protein
MSEVDKSDHLIVLVDDVLGKANPELTTRDAGGLSLRNGKIAYVERGGFGWMAETMVHELGHNLGLGDDEDENGNNYMSYASQRTSFNFEQLQSIHGAYLEGNLNNGRNYSVAGSSQKNWYYHTSTNEQPYYLSVKIGQIIPRKIFNTN